MTKIAIVVFHFANLFVAGTSTSTVASAAPILSIASEQRRLFGYASTSTRPSARTVNRRPKGKNTCTLKFVCLSSKNASTPPSTVRERTDLANHGLGDGSVTFCQQDTVYEGLIKHFTPLKDAGGFELYLHQRGAGDDSGFHIIKPPHIASRLKELAGQAKIYIMPIQRDLIGINITQDSSIKEKVCGSFNLFYYSYQKPDQGKTLRN